jgi:hypothetical protein
MDEYIYELRNEDITSVGGPMHSHSNTRSRWRMLFKMPESAMKFAEEEYGKTIKWVRLANSFTSGDLGHTMYHLTRKVLYP